MASMNFNLRGLNSDLMDHIKEEAKKQHLSVNSLIIEVLEQNFGFSFKRSKQVFHDLDKYAGTWSKEEAKEFENNIKSFEQIDEELWK